MNIYKSLLLLFGCLVLIAACSKNPLKTNVTTSLPTPWWEPLTPDVVINNNEFYLQGCSSITRVASEGSIKTASIVLNIPTRLLSSSPENQSNKRLKYDGTYLTLTLCRVAFGAGGCADERYKTLDFVNWEEYIGITWLKSEKYEAWRKLGSTSSKADSITKVVIN
ncbi:MAG: hypothetical protein V7683_14350 [Pseudoalteromonas distincta]